MPQLVLEKDHVHSSSFYPLSPNWELSVKTPKNYSSFLKVLSFSVSYQMVLILSTCFLSFCSYSMIMSYYIYSDFFPPYLLITDRDFYIFYIFIYFFYGLIE